MANRVFVWGLCTALLIAFTACAAADRAVSNRAEPAGWPQPALSQGEDSRVVPGLSVVYFLKKVRHIDEMPSMRWMRENGAKGPPIALIDHRFGTGKVFDSGVRQGVCVQMEGLLNFEETGTYLLKANSNDGIRVFLDDKMIFEDPDWHGDRFTPQAAVDIRKPGRYAFMVLYFQRKGTATLEMYWQTPASGGFQIIPAAAYSHSAGTSD